MLKAHCFHPDTDLMFLAELPGFPFSLRKAFFNASDLMYSDLQQLQCDIITKFVMKHKRLSILHIRPFFYYTKN